MSTLEILATDSLSFIRLAVANNLNTTEEIKKQVSLFDEYYQTENIPINILEEFSTHYDAGVRGISRN